LILPHIGIEREVSVLFFIFRFTYIYLQVRVCESCYEKHASKEGAKAVETVSSSGGTTITDGPAAGQVSKMDPAIAAARVRYINWDIYVNIIFSGESSSRA
jgi:hypothetical protein